MAKVKSKAQLDKKAASNLEEALYRYNKKTQGLLDFWMSKDTQLKTDIASAKAFTGLVMQYNDQFKSSPVLLSTFIKKMTKEEHISLFITAKLNGIIPSRDEIIRSLQESLK